MNERSDKKRWEGFAPLEPAERRAILAKAVAMTLKPRLAYSTVKNREFEATVARLKPDFAARIRPRADQLWKRVPKERTLKVAAAVFGEEWAERHAKLKRPALAEAVEAAFAGTDPSVDEEGGSVAPSGRGRVRGLRHAAARRRARRAWRAQGGRSQECQEEEGGRGEEEGGKGRRRAAWSRGDRGPRDRGNGDRRSLKAGRGTRRAALPPAGRERQRWTNATRATRKPSPAASAATPGG